MNHWKVSSISTQKKFVRYLKQAVMNIKNLEYFKTELIKHLQNVEEEICDIFKSLPEQMET